MRRGAGTLLLLHSPSYDSNPLYLPGVFVCVYVFLIMCLVIFVVQNSAKKQGPVNHFVEKKTNESLTLKQEDLPALPTLHFRTCPCPKRVHTNVCMHTCVCACVYVYVYI